MPFKRINPLSDDDTFFARHISNIEDAIVYRLCYIGECCISIGRSTNSYTDQTGNLRNSIGYVVVKNGNVIKQVTATSDGAKKGREFIQELLGECKNGIYLIVVAGMNYATYVSAKGFDVLDSAELEAEKLMKQLGFTKR